MSDQIDGAAHATEQSAIASDGQWPLWEVFTQREQGAPHEHAGSLHAADADYLIRLGGGVLAPGGMVRLPGQGPLLTWRAVKDPVLPRAWDLSLGDIELF